MVQKRDDIANLPVVQGGEAGHALIRTPITDHRRQQSALVVMVDDDGADQVRSACPGGVLAMAEAARGAKESLTASHSGRIF
jgi:hypothetical protein